VRVYTHTHTYTLTPFDSSDAVLHRTKLPLMYSSLYNTSHVYLDKLKLGISPYSSTAHNVAENSVSYDWVE